MKSTPDHVDVTALGVHVRLRFADGVSAEQRAAVAHAWQGAAVTGGQPETEIEVKASESLAPFLEGLSSRVTLSAINQRREQLVMFHAAGIAMPDGRTLAFVGPSGRGKTTLSAALGRHYGYVSDETVGIDDTLVVHAHRKPLSVITTQGQPKQQVPPADAGLLDVPDGPLRLAGLILIDRASEPVAASIEQVPLTDALAGLVSEVSYLGMRPQAIQRLARFCTATGGVKRIHYSDAEDAAALVPQLLLAAEPEAWKPALDADLEAEWATAGEFAIHSDVLDAITVGARLVALVNDRLLVLDGIAPAIWRAVRQGADRAGIVTEVVSEHGPPADGEPEELVASVLEEMISLTLLRSRCS